ncbi:hypothetical protein [uncultured Shimia sp.]|uniref:hypothetical protein n=1 Tax=uncultured Shimia sp. TaxID=573152 RepID=UPI0025DE6AB7|nr:hypothetical protein [uncultured Shimia sp.]
MNAVRHCKFREKLFLDEEIPEVNGTNSFAMDVISHNLPLVNDISTIYEMTAAGKRAALLNDLTFLAIPPTRDKTMYLLSGGHLFQSMDEVITRETDVRLSRRPTQTELQIQPLHSR